MLQTKQNKLQTYFKCISVKKQMQSYSFTVCYHGTQKLHIQEYLSPEHVKEA